MFPIYVYTSPYSYITLIQELKFLAQLARPKAADDDWGNIPETDDAYNNDDATKTTAAPTDAPVDDDRDPIGSDDDPFLAASGGGIIDPLRADSGYVVCCMLYV